MLSRQCVRGAHSVARHAAPLAKVPEQTTKVPTGLTVASADNNGPISTFVLAFRAGSRYESPKQAGLVHHIRNMVGTDSKQYGGVKLVWSAAHAGAEISSFSTADVVGVRVSVPRDSSSLALSILGHIAADPAFKEWDLEDVVPTLKTDLAYLQPTDFLFSDVLRAAYRNGSLATPIHASEHNIGKYTGADLRSFASSRFTGGNGVLYGVNIEHDRIVNYGEIHAPVKEGSSSGAVPSPYKGGEWRRDGPGKMAHVLLVGAGAPAGDAAALATQAVLVASLGTGAPTKYGSAQGRGILAGAVKGGAGVSAYEESFEGEGIVGAYILADPSRVSDATHSVARALKSFSADDMEGAKARARLHLLRKSAHSADAATSRAIGILAGLKDGAVLAAIDNVTASAVEAAAKKAASNLSLAAYGAISAVPYRDQL